MSSHFYETKSNQIQTSSLPNGQNNNPTSNGVTNGETATPSPPPEGPLPVQLPVRKSRKGPAPKLFGNELCKICDSKATGFHYNVLSCEACKVIIWQFCPNSTKI